MRRILIVYSTGLVYSGTVLRIAVFLVFASALFGAEGVSFHKQVRPLLEQRCGACHQAGRGAAGVALTSYVGVKASLGRLVPAMMPGMSLN